MAEDSNIPLNQALSGLSTTIQSITGKVEAGKNRVREYKLQIITRLKQVVEQLNSLKENNNLKALPELRKQLKDSQVSLQQKTEELNQTKTNLDEANRNLEMLRQNLDSINRQLVEKNKEISELTSAGNQQNKAIQDLDAQVKELNKEKMEIKRNLESLQQQSNSLVERIGQINATLANQIQLIDSIVNELGNLDSDTDDVAIQFKAVGDNITAIINMINNPSQGGTENITPSSSPSSSSSSPTNDIETNISNLRTLRNDPDKREYLQFMNRLSGQIKNQINNNINAFDTGDKDAEDIIRNILQTNNIQVPILRRTGGKRRRKTMKKRHRRTRKQMRGGYTYNPSKELDKSSSIITGLSGSKTTKLKIQKKDKTRRKSYK